MAGSMVGRAGDFETCTDGSPVTRALSPCKVRQEWKNFGIRIFRLSRRQHGLESPCHVGMFFPGNLAPGGVVRVTHEQAGGGRRR